MQTFQQQSTDPGDPYRKVHMFKQPAPFWDSWGVMASFDKGSLQLVISSETTFIHKASSKTWEHLSMTSFHHRVHRKGPGTSEPCHLHIMDQLDIRFGYMPLGDGASKHPSLVSNFSL
jgi:hypothetical protein